MDGRLGKRRLLGAPWRALALASILASPALGREVTVTGSSIARFGRIVLAFDEPTKVTVRSANGVLVIGFDAPARIRRESLAGDLATYVSAVRRDPDETGLRLALVAPVRTSILEAGERVFIDLLPQGWTGLPPSLPPEAVAALAERARSAERKLRLAEPRRREPARPVSLRFAELPSLTRLVFEPPPGTPVRIKGQGAAVELRFEGVPGLEDAHVRPRLSPSVGSLAPTVEDGALSIKIVAAEGYGAHAFTEGDAVIVDLARSPTPSPMLPHPDPVRPAPTAGAAGGSPLPERPATTERAAPGPVERIVQRSDPTPSPPAPAAPTPSGPVTASFERTADGASLLFPFRTKTAAAAVERDGRLLLVFDTADRLDLAAAASAAGGTALTVEEVRPEGAFSTVRLATADGWPVRLLQEGQAWRLVLGRRAALPPDTLTVTHAPDASGHAQLAVGLRDAAAVRWLKDPVSGAAIAVVPASGRPQAMAAARIYVDFELPPTLQGLVVAPRADDLTVAPGHAGILIGRRAGLTLSPSADAWERRDAPDELVLARDHSIQQRLGSALHRYRELIEAAATAPLSGRAEPRYRLARFLVANGLDLEAGSVLALARSENPASGKRRDVQILSGIAAARAGRLREARAFLGSESLREDAEAGLWRAYLDVRERRWSSALAGFGRWADILGRYPEDVAGALRLAAAGAALEAGELGRAEAELAALERLPAATAPEDEQDLARARLDEQSGRTDAARASYGRLIEAGSRPVAADATLRFVTLEVRSGRMEVAEATRQLEALSVTWRGGDTELGTLIELSSLYGQAGRWRDVFVVARQANHHFPEHELTRILHDAAAKQFEGLFLGDAKLSTVEALSLYYDFKECSPIGRRGDEIVRRLAEWLVGLDLLPQAADLLQHQIDKRLTGAARASVAARLAAIRLLNGEPGPALAALHATRLAELPSHVSQLRLLLEARAQADLTRTDLALEIVGGEQGPEFARLKAEILFGARRWREAGEAGEGLLGRRWQQEAALSARERADVMRAAVAYVSADERLGLDRLKQKFGRKMADSPDAKAFELLQRPGVGQTRDFRAIAQEATRADAPPNLLSDGGGRPDGVDATAAGPEPAKAG